MLRYIPGILLVQLVTAVLLWLNFDESPRAIALHFGAPALLITLVTSLWFASIARADAERMNAKLRLRHAKEKEKLAVNVERDKARVLLKSQKEMRRHEKSVGRKASFKVGLAFVGVTIAGLIMLITELFTFGLMTLTTALGGMGGYLFRGRHVTDTINRDQHIPDTIDADETFAELPPPPKSLPNDN